MESIPCPPGLPLLGNVSELYQVITADVKLEPILRLTDKYDGIVRIQAVGRDFVFISSAELAEELVDERRFIKEPPAALQISKDPKGLFAARSDDPDWAQGHRILMPAMGPLKVEEMFEEMRDIANQLLLKWARQGPQSRILATDDFTRLTLDTIALCAMNYRFNSFYQEGMHPFVDAMLFVLKENGDRSTRPSLVTKMRYSANQKWADCQKVMNSTCQQIIDDRRAHPTEKADLLNTMLYGKDPKTDHAMRNGLIMSQMKNFLVAGHETTSGLLSFTWYYLCKNSGAYLKAQKEVDRVVGRGTIQPHHLKDLKYVQACLREAIRIYPTAPALFKKVNPAQNGSVVLGGKYKIDPEMRMTLLLPQIQTDPKVYGPDAKEFKPERMLDENFNKLPAGAWKPFGNGSRSCIGRPFAWQEATLITALILQNFDVKLDDPAYNLRLKQTLTIKPKELYIRASLRGGIEPTDLDRQLHSLGSHVAGVNGEVKKPKADGDFKPMAIYYGSNTGSCQAFAQRLAADASARGYKATVNDLDSAVNKLPRKTPVVLISASYEGQPPDNATRFVEWLQQQDGGSMKDIDFAVFGCGHKDWAKTLHRIPMLIDQYMGDWGAHRLAPVGLTDASKGNMFGDFEDWLEDGFWPALISSVSASAQATAPEIEISTNARASSLRYDVNLATVCENKCLTAQGEPEKWHTEVQLPSDSAYDCGDYLAILPMNSEESVRRIMTHFQLPWDAVVTMKTAGPSTIPANTPLSVYDVLRSYVELAQPATRKTLKTCAQYATSQDEQVDLHTLAEDPQRFEAEVLAKRTSVMDILSQHPSIALPFAEFLSLLPPLRVRQYSISSTPLVDPTRCTITYGVIKSQHARGDPDAAFHGVCGTYLSSLKKGDTIQVAVKTTAKKLFRLPCDPEQTPLMMFAAGTGLAPFRGFIAQRAEMLKAVPGRKLARAVLWLGCRRRDGDRLYAQEMDRWITDGAVDVRYSFSKEPEKSDECAYVSERMDKDKAEVIRLWGEGARVYICGSRVFEHTVGKTARAVVVEEVRRKLKAGEPIKAAGGMKRGEGEGASLEELVEAWFKEAVAERVASDVFD